MLFIIDQEIIMADDEHFLECFENLLLGYKEGYHLLFIKPKIVDLITKQYDDKMDERMKNQFYHYQEEFMIESSMALELVNYAIKIVPKTTEEGLSQFSEKLTIGSLHTDKFLSSSTIQRTVLLGENPSDGDIYEIFAKEYIKLNNSTLKIQLKIDNGGGSTTGSTFARKISNNQELCLCILDSDKKFPSDARGATAKKVIKETRYIENPKYAYYIEDKCRELENILPLGFYYQQYLSLINIKDIFDDFQELNRINNRLIYYFDMKNGVKHYDIRKYNSWSELLTESSKYNIITTCTENNFCSKKDNCKHIMIESFGSKVLENFIEFYNQPDNYQINLILNSSDEYIKKIWTYIGKLVFSWGCGQEKIIINT